VEEEQTWKHVESTHTRAAVSMPPTRLVRNTTAPRTEQAKRRPMQPHGLSIANTVCQKLKFHVCAGCVPRCLLCNGWLLLWMDALSAPLRSQRRAVRRSSAVADGNRVESAAESMRNRREDGAQQLCDLQAARQRVDPPLQADEVRSVSGASLLLWLAAVPRVAARAAGCRARGHSA
jgi:hypothetical protein